jgi:RNA-directed DNA polymerase
MHVRAGHKWVAEIDLVGFCDTVDHQRLRARVRAVVEDNRVLRLVHACLKAGVMVSGVVAETREGSPRD